MMQKEIYIYYFCKNLICMKFGEPMKKIGILHCIHANEVCAAVGCLNAFMKKQDFFEPYELQEIELGAFFSCNGCKSERPLDPGEDAGIIEKIEITLSLIIIVVAGIAVITRITVVVIIFGRKKCRW